MTPNSVIAFNFRMRGGGKRARSTTTADFDRDAELHGMRSTTQAKILGLQLDCFQSPARAAAVIQAFLPTVDANSLSDKINQLNLTTMQEMANSCKKTTNSDSKLRCITKALFKRELGDVMTMEAMIKDLKEMREGIYDKTVKLMVSHAFMGTDGSINWDAFESSLDKVVQDRIFNAGRVAGPLPDAQMHPGA
jgi:hypothetical protein